MNDKPSDTDNVEDSQRESAFRPNWERVLDSVQSRFVVAIRQRMGKQIQAKLSAHDLFASALLRGFERLDQFQGSTDPEFEGWLWAILVHKLDEKIRMMKTQGRDIDREQTLSRTEKFEQASDHQAEDTISPADAVVIEELNELVRSFVEDLPTVQRDAMRLIGLQQLTRREAAEKLGVSEGVVSGHYYRGLSTFTRALKEKLN